MSIDTTWQTKSTSSEQTEQIAERLGRNLRGGEVVELVSDLGGGKTTFVRGMVRGTDSQDKVASPSFTISKVYGTKIFDIHHFDLYRLAEAGIIADEIAEIVGDPQTVIVVEWADVAHHVLPAKRLTITIAQTPEGDRLLSFRCPKTLDYLMKGLN